MAKVGMVVQSVVAVDNTGLIPELLPDREWTASPQGYGNLATHRRVLMDARELDSIIVFEDDAAVPNDFDDRLDALVADIETVDLNWEAIYLGGENMRVPRHVTPGVGRVRFTIRTHAYLLRRPAIVLALGIMRTCSDHWDVPLAEQLAERGHTYAPMPFLVGNLGFPSDIPDSIPIGKYT